SILVNRAKFRPRNSPPGLVSPCVRLRVAAPVFSLGNLLLLFARSRKDIAHGFPVLGGVRPARPSSWPNQRRQPGDRGLTTASTASSGPAPVALRASPRTPSARRPALPGKHALRGRRSIPAP